MFQTIITVFAASIAAIFTFQNYRHRAAQVLWVKEPIAFRDHTSTSFEVNKNGVKNIRFSRIGQSAEIHGDDGEYVVIPWSQVKFLGMPNETLTKHVSRLKFWQ